MFSFSEHKDSLFLIGTFRVDKEQLAWILNKHRYNIRCQGDLFANRRGEVSELITPDYIIIYSENLNDIHLFSCNGVSECSQVDMINMDYPSPKGSYLVFSLENELSLPEINIAELKQLCLKKTKHEHYPALFNGEELVFIDSIHANNNVKQLKAVSLFSCIGVSEYYLHDIGVDVIVASDIDKRRCEVHNFLYPQCSTICGDICDINVKNQICDATRGEKIDLVISTPPCQGMSTVGKNKGNSLLSSEDKRNYLILESFDVIDRLNPDYAIFENVPQLLKIRLPYDGKIMKIQDILQTKYGNEYNIKIDKFNTCNYGIPQSRERVFIRLFRKGKTWNDPIAEPKIPTLRDAIGDLPSLEAGEMSNLKNHWARKHPENQIDWLRHTPTGCSALLNESHYPVKENGERIKAYPNTYKRMVWDAPAPTITMRNEIMSSQDKVHPGRYIGNGLWSDARVLTLRELLIVMSLPADLDLPTFITDTALRQFIGEGIPSLMMKKLIEGIC